MKDNETPVSLADGTPISVRAIKPAELDRIVLRCWPERETLDRLFVNQGTIGMAAWEGDKCVAQLHCYQVTAPDGKEWWVGTDGPMGANWWTDSDRVFEGWGQWGPSKSELGLSGPVWCHACFHVGRTLDDPEENKARYLGRGIGTALCKESIRWAQEHGHVAVVAPGSPHGVPHFTSWYGHLPWTTYAKLGFRDYPVPLAETSQLPGWAKGEVHEPIASEIKDALRTRPVNEILERLMVLDLENSQPADPGEKQ
ncbi:MAG: GNAT family N-acetyltransferase [Planctomycetota bacterium]|jgi:GNAT superfamily N-acetyltransferase|nr:GNAT family N-acetyltransferase [Planctomycetota bacterium]